MSNSGEILVTRSGLPTSIYSPSTGYLPTPGGFPGAYCIRGDGEVLLQREQSARWEVWKWDRGNNLTQYLSPAGYENAGAESFSATGAAVGYVWSGFGNYLPVRWNSPTSVDFLRGPGGTAVTGSGAYVNDNGYCIGVDGLGNALLWAPGQTTGSYISIGGNRLKPAGLTENGWILGYHDASPLSRNAYILNTSGAIVHQFSVATGQGIILKGANSRGLVAGSIYALNGSGGSSFLWTQATGVVGLDSLVDTGLNGDQLVHVNHVGEDGAIIAQAAGDTMNPKWYYLTPVPEPGSLAVLGIGIAAVMMKRRSGLNSAKTKSKPMSPH